MTKIHLGGGLFKSKKVRLSLLIILLITLIIGTTFAFWVLTKKQEGTNLVNSACFNVTFEDGDGITLTDAYPLSKEELYNNFFKTAEPYTFTVTNTCNNLASATINLESLPVETKQLGDKYIGVILYDGSKDIVKNMPIYSRNDYKLVNHPLNNKNKIIKEAINAYDLYDFTLKENESRKFKLLVFMHEDTPALEETMNAEWQGKITISVSYKEDVFADSGTLRNIDYYDSKGMWEQKGNITKIVIENKLEPKTGDGVIANDESALHDKSVMSYLVPQEDGTYIAYLQGNGGVKGGNGSIFSGFSRATTIEGLENYDTRNVTDMNHMFSNSGFTELDLSTFDTSNVQNMISMFDGVRNITKLNISNFNTSNVTDMSGMFGSCGVSNLNLSSFDTSKVQNMVGMFQRMPNIAEIDLSTFDTSEVKDMARMFSNSGFTKLDLSSFNTGNVKSMVQMFATMSKIKELNLSNFDTSQVENMSEMFGSYYGNSSLQKIDISSFDTSQVDNMFRMFSGLNNLTSLTLGEHFVTNNVENMSEMFGSHGTGLQLTELDLSTFDTSNVNNMAGMFRNMSNLTKLNLGSDFNTSNVEDMNNMFYGLSNLEELNLGNKFDTSKVTNMNTMFYGMNKLKSLDLGNLFNTSLVTDMSGMFNGLEELTYLNLGNQFNTGKVENMYLMFHNLKKLEELNLGDKFDTSLVKNMNSMFGSMESLISLDLGSKFNTSNVKDMGGMFSNMFNLTELNLGSLFDTSNVDNMNLMFQGLLKLDHIEYGEKFVHKDGANITNMFNNSSDLNKPDGETWKDVKW